MKTYYNVKDCSKIIAVEFSNGKSMRSLARKHKLPLLTIEAIIRYEMNRADLEIYRMKRKTKQQTNK